MTSCYCRVWSWGWGVHGQTGVGATDDLLVPVIAKIGKEVGVSYIEAGFNHSAVIDKEVCQRTKGLFEIYQSTSFSSPPPFPPPSSLSLPPFPPPPPSHPPSLPFLPSLPLLPPPLLILPGQAVYIWQWHVWTARSWRSRQENHSHFSTSLGRQMRVPCSLWQLTHSEFNCIRIGHAHT